jgi:hypothetical protein
MRHERVDAQRLKAPVAANAKLKKLRAEPHLSAAAQRIERTWAVVGGDPTISLRQKA